MPSPTICLAVLAHNEERRIAACLASLLSQAGEATIHVLVNGASDRTAEIARAIPAANLQVHEFAEGGKARTWNRFVFDRLDAFADVHVFVDGDAEVAPGSIAALAAALAGDDHASLASALPLNGRGAERYRDRMRAEHGVFGDLYAVKGTFLARMKAAGIRLPDDLVGDDGLVAAMAKTDLANEDRWDDARVTVCEGAGFLCEPVQAFRFRTIRMQYRRMISYSVRHFQNRIISRIMRGEGPSGLPRRLAAIYGDHRDLLVPRRSFPLRHFDRRALSRMRAAMASA